MADDNQVSVQFTATTAQLEDAAKKSQAAVQQFTEGVKQAADTTTASMNKAGIATAGTTRELIVLAHEVVSGNFSRIPGSMMVLAERSGNLHGIVAGLAEVFANPLVLAVTAATAVFGYFEISAFNTQKALEEVQIGLIATGQSGKLSEDQIKSYTKELSDMAGVSKKEAVESLDNLVRVAGLSEEKIHALQKSMYDISAAMRTDVPGASKIVAEAMEDPVRALEKLQKQYNLLSVAQLEEFRTAQLAGDKEKEQAILVEALTTNFAGLSDKIESATKNLELWWQWLTKSNDATSKANQFDYNFNGELTASAKAGREREDLAKDSDMTYVNQEILKLKRQQNDAVKDGILLQSKLSDQVDRDVRLQREIGQLQKSKNAATAIGDVGQAASFQKSIDSIQQKITEDQKRANDQRLKNWRDTETAKLTGEKQFAEEMNSLQAEQVRLMYDEGKISSRQEMQMLLDLKNQEYQTEMSALQKEETLWAKHSAEWEKIQNQMTKVKLKSQLDREKIIDQEVKIEEQKWKTLFNSFNQGIVGMLNGTMTFRQGLASMLDGALNVFLTKVEEMAAKWITTEILKTTVTQTQNAARTASTTGAIVAADAVGKAHAIGTLTADGALTFGGVFANLAPFLGPAAAGPAAASQALVMAQLPAASFDIGTNVVPNDMMANIHKGERIIPAADNRRLMDALEKGGSRGGGVTVNLNGPVYGMKDFQQAVVNAVVMAKRNLNQSLAGAAR
jgi:phage-related minor tail protein